MGFVPEERSSLAHIGDQLRRLNRNIEALCGIISSNKPKIAGSIDKEDEILNKYLHCKNVEAYDREVSFIREIESRIRYFLVDTFTELPPNNKLDAIFQFSRTIYIASRINHVCHKISLSDAFGQAVLAACKCVGLQYDQLELPVHKWNPLYVGDVPCQEIDELVAKDYGAIHRAALSDIDEILSEYYPSITSTETNLIHRFWKFIYLDVNESFRKPLNIVQTVELGPEGAKRVRVLNAVDNVAVKLGIFDPSRPNEYDTDTIFHGAYPDKMKGLVEGYMRRHNYNTTMLDEYGWEICPGDRYFVNILGNGKRYAVKQNTIRKGRLDGELAEDETPSCY